MFFQCLSFAPSVNFLEPLLAKTWHLVLLELSSDNSKSCCLMLCPFRKETHGLIFSAFVQARTEGLKSPSLSSSVFDLGPFTCRKTNLDFVYELQRIYYNWSKKSSSRRRWKLQKLLRLERTSGDHLVHLPSSKEAQLEQDCDQSG